MGYINKKDNECAWAVDDNRGMITEGSLTLLMDEDKVKFKRVDNVSEDHKAGTIFVSTSIWYRFWYSDSSAVNSIWNKSLCLMALMSFLRALRSSLL